MQSKLLWIVCGILTLSLTWQHIKGDRGKDALYYQKRIAALHQVQNALHKENAELSLALTRAEQRGDSLRAALKKVQLNTQQLTHRKHEAIHAIADFNGDALYGFFTTLKAPPAGR